MDRKSLERLKFDWRLIRRRNWISSDELRRELDALPDVADKVAPIETADSSPTQVCRVDYDTCINCSLCAIMCPWDTISMALTQGEAEELATRQGTLPAPAA